MKKLFLIFVILSLLILTGCGSQISSNQPYINEVTPDKSFGSESEVINILVSIKNPTKVNYNGNVLVQADKPECFGMRNVDGFEKDTKGYMESISVLAGSKNSALIKINIPSDNQNECYQPTTEHKLTIFLLQEGQINKLDVLGSKEIDFSLFNNEG